MVQIVKQSGFGTQLGQALGSGLGTGLQDLAKKKIQQIQLEKAGLPGALAHLDPQVQAAFLRNFGAQQQKSQKQQQEESISQGFFETKRPPQEQPEESQRGIQEERVEPFVPQSPGARGAFEVENVERALAGKTIPEADKAKILERIEKSQDRFNKQQKTIDTKNEKWLDGIREADEGARQADERLNFMEELIESGELPGPLLTTFSDAIERGIPIPFTKARLGINLKGLLFSTQGQQFDKITKDFAKDARKFFPRVTEGQVKLFLETVPTLLQSDAGKKEITNTLRFFNAGSKLNFDTAQRLIDENKGFQPPNLQSRVDKIVKPQKDELSKQLIQHMRNTAKLAKQLRGKPKTSLLERIGVEDKFDKLV